MQKTLLFLGITLLLAGLLWPWLGRFPLGRLPGDLVFSPRPGVKIFLPLTSMVLLSLLFSLLIRLFRK